MEELKRPHPDDEQPVELVESLIEALDAYGRATAFELTIIACGIGGVGSLGSKYYQLIVRSSHPCLGDEYRLCAKSRERIRCSDEEHIRRDTIIVPLLEPPVLGDVIAVGVAELRLRIERETAGKLPCGVWK